MREPQGAGQGRLALILCDEQHMAGMQRPSKCPVVAPLQQMLKAQGFAVFLAENGGDALGLLDADHFTLVLVEIGLPDLDAFHEGFLKRYDKDSGAAAWPTILHLHPPGDWSHSPEKHHIGAMSIMRHPDPSEFRVRVHFTLAESRRPRTYNEVMQDARTAE